MSLEDRVFEEDATQKVEDEAQALKEKAEMLESINEVLDHDFANLEDVVQNPGALLAIMGSGLSDKIKSKLLTLIKKSYGEELGEVMEIKAIAEILKTHENPPEELTSYFLKLKLDIFTEEQQALITTTELNTLYQLQLDMQAHVNTIKFLKNRQNAPSKKNLKWQTPNR